MQVNGHEARAIMIGNRYFYGFGYKGRTLTAWSLAGAKLFVFTSEHTHFHRVTEKLKAKGKEFNVITIGRLTDA